MPAIVFEVKPQHESADVYLNGTPPSECFGAFVDADVGATRPPEQKATEVMFLWTRLSIQECRSVQEPDDSRKTIVLNIFDGNGRSLGTERIPFSIQINGHYIVPDSL
jgi:hypothetical protein